MDNKDLWNEIMDLKVEDVLTREEMANLEEGNREFDKLHGIDPSTWSDDETQTFDSGPEGEEEEETNLERTPGDSSKKIRTTQVPIQSVLKNKNTKKPSPYFRKTAARPPKPYSWNIENNIAPQKKNLVETQNVENGKPSETQDARGRNSSEQKIIQADQPPQPECNQSRKPHEPQNQQNMEISEQPNTRYHKPSDDFQNIPKEDTTFPQSIQKEKPPEFRNVSFEKLLKPQNNETPSDPLTLQAEAQMEPIFIPPEGTPPYETEILIGSPHCEEVLETPETQTSQTEVSDSIPEQYEREQQDDGDRERENAAVVLTEFDSEEEKKKSSGPAKSVDPWRPWTSDGYESQSDDELVIDEMRVEVAHSEIEYETNEIPNDPTPLPKTIPFNPTQDHNYSNFSNDENRDTNNNDESFKYQCEVCSMTFMSMYIKNRHFTTVHPSMKKLGCDKCQLELEVGSEAQNHFCHQSLTDVTKVSEKTTKKNYKMKYICQYCEIERQNLRALAAHVKNKHKNAETFTCTLCGDKINADVESATRHFCKKGKNFQCRYCKKIFRSSQYANPKSHKCKEYEKNMPDVLGRSPHYKTMEGSPERI